MMSLKNRNFKTLCTAASILLIIIGIFHGSGINYINGLVQESDVSQLVKNIFPVLFILPSLELIGLGIIAFFAVKQPTNHNILLTLSILILIDSILAFWLNAIIPGLILLTPSLIFLLAAWSKNNKP